MLTYDHVCRLHNELDAVRIALVARVDARAHGLTAAVSVLDDIAGELMTDDSYQPPLPFRNAGDRRTQ